MYFSNPNVTKSIGLPYDNDAIEIVQAMPKWKPGKIKGVSVKVYYTIPVRF